LKRVIVSVTNDLVIDQRVHKVCTTLIKQNFDVLLIGRKSSNSISINRDYPIYRMKLYFNKGFLFYAEYNVRLFIKLLFLKKDVLLSNDLDTLLSNYFISRILHKNLIYDSHELFTEIPELIDRPKTKKIWLFIEKKILPKLDYCYTVSNSIANHYGNLYGSSFKVIRNLPYKSTSKNGFFPFNTENKKIILYQGAINMGRGVDLMIDAINYLENTLLIIIGDGDLFDQLVVKVKNQMMNEKVKFLGKISPKELLQLTPLADIGLSLEEDMGLNYRYALPNKLFDYIQAQVPVIVSDLPEMKKIVQEYNVGEILHQRSPKALAKIITVMLDKGKRHWRDSLNKASNELVWQNESIKLKKIFNDFK
jgi:glycosyltransferase involved in cell wall biosynthesis